MAFKYKIIRGVSVIKLRGAFVGGESIDEIKERVKALTGSGTKRFLFDFSRVTKMNSHGLGMMLSCYSNINSIGGVLGITGLTGPIENVLNITKVITLFERYPSLRSGIKAMHE